VSADALVIDSHRIRRDGEMWCLTDLWRAAGSPAGQRPANWLRKEGSTFVEFLRTTLDVPQGHIVKAAKKGGVGGGGDTWAHWQIGIAYAGYLSPAFKARVQEIFAAYKAGLLVSSSSDREELIRLTLRTTALEAERMSVWDRDLKSELARLRGIKWDGRGVEPKGLTFPYGRVWRIVLGDTTYEELKQRNPYPRDSSVHQQWLQEQRYEIAKRDMVRVLDTARRCVGWTEFETDLRSVFRRSPTQLRLIPRKAS
jgi:hypothetical protein